ncbi:MAG: poly-gamma-glutamate hydrolase family protein, partial [Bacillota bacterium]
MIKKIIHGFFSFIRFIVCFCLIILINTLMFIESSDGIYGNSEESNKLQVSKLRALSLNLEEIPESEISPMIKELDYKAKTRMTDFGDYKIETNVTASDITVIAIHGGRIEQGTTELAYALSSRNNYNYFSFLGVKNYENSSLHIDSD